MSFATMVLTGANGASPHGTPGHTKIQKGDFVLFDLGVLWMDTVQTSQEPLPSAKLMTNKKKSMIPF